MKQLLATVLLQLVATAGLAALELEVTGRALDELGAPLDAARVTLRPIIPRYDQEREVQVVDEAGQPVVRAQVAQWPEQDEAAATGNDRVAVELSRGRRLRTRFLNQQSEPAARAVLPVGHNRTGLAQGCHNIRRRGRERRARGVCLTRRPPNRPRKSRPTI